MQKTLIKLLRLQILLLVVFTGGVWLFAGWAGMLAAVAGGCMAVLATGFAIVIFRRLPRVMPAGLFFRGMVICEIGKWIVVVVMGSIVLRHYPPLWVLLGFIAVYSAYFWMMLFDRGQ